MQVPWLDSAQASEAIIGPGLPRLEHPQPQSHGRGTSAKSAYQAMGTVKAHLSTLRLDRLCSSSFSNIIHRHCFHAPPGADLSLPVHHNSVLVRRPRAPLQPPACVKDGCRRGRVCRCTASSAAFLTACKPSAALSALGGRPAVPVSGCWYRRSVVSHAGALPARLPQRLGEASASAAAHMCRT